MSQSVPKAALAITVSSFMMLYFDLSSLAAASGSVSEVLSILTTIKRDLDSTLNSSSVVADEWPTSRTLAITVIFGLDK